MPSLATTSSQAHAIFNKIQKKKQQQKNNQTSKLNMRPLGNVLGPVTLIIVADLSAVFEAASLISVEVSLKFFSFSACFLKFKINFLPLFLDAPFTWAK